MAHPVMQWQLLARNPARLAAFYRQLFGWSSEGDPSRGCQRLQSGGQRGIEGEIWPIEAEGRSRLALAVEVEDVAAYLQRAAALGGRILMPPQPQPDGGEVGLFSDPAGLEITVFRPAPSPASDS